MSVLTIVIVVAALVVFVTLPALIALIRRHPEARTIARLTPFAAVSIVLWVALLTWAVSDKRDDSIVARYVARLRERRLLPWVVGVLAAAGLVGSFLALR
jgi:hypothetical protein